MIVDIGSLHDIFITLQGFTLIALFEGFIIVTVIDLGGPGWLVGLVAILGVLVGRWAIGVAERQAGQRLFDRTS